MPSPATAEPSHFRVLIVDADRRVRDSLGALCRCEPGFGQVDAAATPAEVRAALDETEPDVLVIDPRLPDVETGLDLIAELRRDHPGVRILVMSWSPSTDAVAHDADGLLDKTGSPEDLVSAIAEAVAQPRSSVTVGGA
jgi:DNA-binding NarL/FixJ family response regulator